jgi:anti-sigma factor RsiW
MKTIEPFELSAYLDGELDAVRTREIESALDRDPALRAELESMQTLDAAWVAAARTAVSRPSLRLDPVVGDSRLIVSAAVIVVGLLAVRLVPKFVDLMTAGLLAHLVVLAATLAWLIRSDD